MSRPVCRLSTLLSLSLLASSLLLPGCGSKTITGTIKPARPTPSIEVKPRADASRVSDELKEKVAESCNRFALRWLQETLQANRQQNELLCPVSVYAQLCLLQNGAKGATKSRLTQLLSLEGLTLQQTNDAMNALLLSLAPQSEEASAKHYFSFWASPTVKLLPEYAQQAASYYGGVAFEMPAEPTPINEWLKKYTNSWTNPPALTNAPKGSLLMLGAVGFNSHWDRRFFPSQKTKAPFHRADGSPQEATFMNRSDGYQHLKTETFQAISAPFAGGQWEFFSLLPAQNRVLRDLAKPMTWEQWDKWHDAVDYQQGEFSLPVLRLSNLESPSQSLSALKKDELNAARADYSGLASASITPLEIKTGAQLDIDVLGVNGGGQSDPEPIPPPASGKPNAFQFKADRPFLFFIVDNGTGLIVFIGIVRNV